MDECKFFQTKQGCRFGDKCRFIHVEEMSGSLMDAAYESRESGKSHGGIKNTTSLVEGNQRVQQFHSPLYRKRNGCKFFNTKRGCSRGDKCPFLHVMRDNNSQGKTSYGSKMLGSEQRVIVEEKAHNPPQRKDMLEQVASNDRKTNQKTDFDASLEFEKQLSVKYNEQEGHAAHVSNSRTKKQRSRTIPSNKNKKKQAENNEDIPPFRQKSRAKDTDEVFKFDPRKINENAVGIPPSKEQVANKYTMSGERTVGVFTEKNYTGSPTNHIGTKGVNKYKSRDKWQIGVLTEKNETMSPNQEAEAKGTKLHRDVGTVKESHAKDVILNKDNNMNNKQKQRYSKPYTSENYTSNDRVVYTLADAIFAEPKRIRSTEIQQLKRRFGCKNGYVEIKENSVYKVQFKPTDPDWPFKIEAVYLTVSFPEDYPLHIFSALLSKEQDLPENIFSFVNQRIQEYTTQQEQMGHNQGNMKMYFRPFLRWFDKNLASFFAEAGKEMTKVFVSRMGLSDKTVGESYIDQPKTMANAADSSPNSTQDFTNMEEGSNGCHHDVVPVNQVMESFQKNTMVMKENTKKTIISNAEIIGQNIRNNFFENSEDFNGDKNVNELEHKGKVENAYGTGVCEVMDIELDLSNPMQDTEGIMVGSQASHEQGCSNEHSLESSLSSTHGNDSTPLKGVERGTRIQFKGLHLEESTSSMRANKILFTLECSRCKQRMDQQLTAAVSAFKQCTRCASAFAVMYRPTVIHQFSSILGYLDIEGCLPFDVVLPESEFMLGCFHCSKETLVKGLQYGGNQSWCSHCHQKLRFQVQCTRFQQLQTGVSNPEVSLQKSMCAISSNPSKPKKTLRNPGLKEGQPLPGNGTCKHYKKSYRWLRFPCCGKCYACDVCHEEAEDHELKFATRMVCGFCSKEQPYSQQPCSGCKAAVTKSHSTHWEGGKGCRDKVTMSRNDNRKYKQSGKTTSRKAQKQSEGKGKRK